MGLHANTVFKNSCLKVPINPTSRLPSAKFERNSPLVLNLKKNSIDSFTSDLRDDVKNQLSFREFYKSIPDYEDVTHMSNQEFYLKVESLRENKNKLLMKCGHRTSNENSPHDFKSKDESSPLKKYISMGSNTPISSKYETTPYSRKKYTPDSVVRDGPDYLEKYKSVGKNDEINSDIDSILSLENKLSAKNKPSINVTNFDKVTIRDSERLNVDKNNYLVSKSENKVCTPRYVDHGSVFDDLSIPAHKYSDNHDNIYKKSYSLPTSPVKRRKYDMDTFGLTEPKPYKMTEREEGKQIFDHLKDYTKDLENKLLIKKSKHKQFRANPVPIESRIPLFDKIMEDQELRRSISKLQSTAELQAQMKPFKFTEREERQSNLSNCYRLCRSNPHLALESPSDRSQTNAKTFRAKPVPKNLFSNYIYDKMREDDFYRTLNRRIRTEEMLKASSLPPSMAKRDKVRKDSPESPAFNQNFNQDSLSSTSTGSTKTKKRKGKKNTRTNHNSRKSLLNQEYQDLKKEFISSGSPRKSAADGKTDFLKKMYGAQSITPPSSGYQNRVQSASDVASINRSNLAAILRMEATKRKMEADMVKLLEEERFQSEIKWRDSVLRRKPAWNSIKYSHADDLAMRLQTRRDEERLRREQFLHDMELMYGRVHQQPMMFERIYGPRRYASKRDPYSSDIGHKPRSALMNRDSTTPNMTPNRSRKVSINETAETIHDDVDDFLYRSTDDDDKESKSSDIPESIENGYQMNENKP